MDLLPDDYKGDIFTKSISYINEFDSSAIDGDDSEVWFVDYSFSNKANLQSFLALKEQVPLGNIVWIDHHKTSKEMIEADEAMANYVGLVDADSFLSGAFLTWFFISTLYYTASAHIYLMIPRFIQYVSDWDTFTHAMPGTIDFKGGMDSEWDEYMKLKENKILWANAFSPDTENQVIESVLKTGQIITKYAQGQARKYDRLTGHAVKMKCHGKLYNTYTMNVCGGSLAFGDHFAENDFVMSFTYNGEKGLYVYSMYSIKDPSTEKTKVDVSEIAKMFGGGGHPGAAGFSLSMNLLILEEDGVIDLDQVLETVKMD
jgi:oligoribonuclease NrnB/cAMP/cGMP phosphodiesterase (DHH superfamily)